MLYVCGWESQPCIFTLTTFTELMFYLIPCFGLFGYNHCLSIAGFKDEPIWSHCPASSAGCFPWWNGSSVCITSTSRTWTLEASRALLSIIVKCNISSGRPRQRLPHPERMTFSHRWVCLGLLGFCCTPNQKPSLWGVLPIIETDGASRPHPLKSKGPFAVFF